MAAAVHRAEHVMSQGVCLQSATRSVIVSSFLTLRFRRPPSSGGCSAGDKSALNGNRVMLFGRSGVSALVQARSPHPDESAIDRSNVTELKIDAASNTVSMSSWSGVATE